MIIEIKEKLQFPNHLDIELTNYCQLKCVMCPRKYMTRKQGFMSWELFKKIIDEAKGKTKTCYLHQFGESLLHPEIFKMIKYANKAGLWTSLSTNGVTLSKLISKRLFEAGLSHMFLSLDSLNPRVLEGIRVGIDGEKAIKRINNCIKIRRNTSANTKLEIQMIEMEENVNERDAYEKKYKPLMAGIGKVSFKSYCMYAGNVPNKSSKLKELKLFKCTMFNYSVTIQWNGDIVVCCMDYDGVTKFGNVNNMGIREIWDSPEYRQFRLAHKRRDLSKLVFCRGCYWASEFVFEDFPKVKKMLEEHGTVPRLNLDTISYLKKVLNDQKSVLEIGSGSSTIWLAKRARKVVSVEHEKTWYEAVKEKLGKESLNNVRQIFNSDYYKDRVLTELVQGEEFDVVFVDGADYTGARVNCIKQASMFVKPGGIIIIDDSERRAYDKGLDYFNSYDWKRIDFEGKDAWDEDKRATIYIRPEIERRLLKWTI